VKLVEFTALQNMPVVIDADHVIKLLPQDNHLNYSDKWTTIVHEGGIQVVAGGITEVKHRLECEEHVFDVGKDKQAAA